MRNLAGVMAAVAGLVLATGCPVPPSPPPPPAPQTIVYVTVSADTIDPSRRAKLTCYGLNDDGSPGYVIGEHETQHPFGPHRHALAQPVLTYPHQTIGIFAPLPPTPRPIEHCVLEANGAGTFAATVYNVVVELGND